MFSCERTYNRAFKEEFNVTPNKWRRNPIPLKILDRFNADFMNCAGNGLIFLRSISVLPTVSIAGLEYEINEEEISSLTLKEIWNYVEETWMPTVEFHLTEQLHFEYINYAKCNKSYCECDLYYPINEI